MGENRAARKGGVRQWQLSLTEERGGTMYLLSLRWRTFPCRHDHWDGVRFARILSLGTPIRSADDLQAVLSLFVDVDLQDVDRRSLAADPTEV